MNYQRWTVTVVPNEKVISLADFYWAIKPQWSLLSDLCPHVLCFPPSCAHICFFLFSVLVISLLVPSRVSLII